MPVLDKQKLLAFSKKKAQPPLAANALAQKRAMAPKPALPAVNPLPGAHAAPPPPTGKPAMPPKPGALPPGAPPAPAAAAPAAPGGPKKVMPLKPPPAPGHDDATEAPHPGEEQEVHIFELVEDAAQAAEGAVDPELEDIITSAPESQGPDDPPQWAGDPEKWKEAAEAVGLGAGAEDKYEEPFVVTAYLYKMIGGAVATPGEDGEMGPPPPPADVTKPGGAAAALHARGAARAAAPGGQ